MCITKYIVSFEIEQKLLKELKVVTLVVEAESYDDVGLRILAHMPISWSKVIAPNMDLFESSKYSYPEPDYFILGDIFPGKLSFKKESMVVHKRIRDANR